MTGAGDAGAPVSVRVRPLGDRAAIADLGRHDPSGAFRPLAPDATASALTLSLTAAVRSKLGDAVDDLVPAYRSVLIAFDPARVSLAEVLDVCQAATLIPASVEDQSARTVTLPTWYGDAAGPDLDDVARHTGLSPVEVVAAHAAGDYRVAFLGFSPGYAYLLGLPERLATPRLASPRAAVPVGSVSIGGQQTGVYPQATPGGWRLIGRTPVPLFDPRRRVPALLRAGDRVVFRPIEAAEYRAIEVGARLGRYLPEVIPEREAGLAAERAPTGLSMRRSGRHLEVVVGGLSTTVQDEGRPGLGAQGISPGGAMDRAAALLANRLVGNPPGAAVLESCVAGPTVRVSAPVIAALTGASAGLSVDGRTLPVDRAHRLPAGAICTVLPGPAGVRSYLAVRGGIDVPPVIGSRSTDLTAGVGGLDGRRLTAGDVLPIGQEARGPISPPVTVGPRSSISGGEITLRVVVGPEDGLLVAGDLDRLLATAWGVSSRSSHMGVRLTGPALAVADAGDLVSEGIATGTVQVPASGEPIILLPGRGTVGGYAKVACVIDADLDRAAQLRAGSRVRFRAVALRDAIRAGQGYRAGLEWLRGGHDAALRDASASLAHLGVATVPVLPAAGGPRAVEPAPGPAPSLPDVLSAEDVAPGVIRSPGVGRFHRGGRSGAEPLAVAGARVAAGVTVAGVTVMDQWQDVVTHGAVEVVAFLVREGDPVAYGQPVISVRPIGRSVGPAGEQDES